MKNAKPIVAALAFIISSALAGPALADRDFAVERFRLAADRDGLLGVEWAAVPGHLSWDMGLWIGLADDPLVINRDMDAGSERIGELVSSRVGGSLSGSLAIRDRLQLAVDVPLILAQNQDEVAALMTGELSSFGLGDIRLMPKLQLIGNGRTSTAVAVIAGLTLPTSSGSDYRGQSGFGFAPELAVSRAYGAVRLSSNLGYRMRDDAQLFDLDVEDEIVVRLGAGYRMADADGPPVELDLTVSAATAASSPFAVSNQSHLEALAGATYDFAGPVLGVAAAGVGINDGFGTPDWRFIVGVRVSSERDSDRDGDGIIDRRDACPDVAEDRDGFEDSDGCLDLDNDRDGIADEDDRCPDVAENINGFEDSDGCPDVLADSDRDQDTVVDRRDNCPDTPGVPAYQGCPEPQKVSIEEGSLRLMEKVHFATDSDEISPMSFPLLRNAAAVLAAHPDIKHVEIAGHTDNRGKARYNRNLSQRRSESVVRFLVAEGIDKSRLSARGYGESRPIDSNDTETGRANNRRVEFNITESGAVVSDSRVIK
ncbi:MAG: OmpA family protein [Myxococcota bacterium]